MPWFWNPRNLLSVSIAAVSNRHLPTPVSRAEQAFSYWKDHILLNQSYIHCSPSGGLGNTIMSVISAGILALYFTKPIVCPGCRALDFHFPHVSTHGMERVERFPDIDRLYQKEFSRSDPRSFEMWFFASDHLYLHEQIGLFLHKCFGEYAIYYIGNYFISVPQDVKSRVGTFLGKIPRNFVTVGVHIRTHFGMIPAFMAHVDRGCTLIGNFLESHFHGKPFQVALATDSGSVANTLRGKVPKLVQTGVDGSPDGDKHSALIDFYMIQSCDVIVLTYRSTFSILASALANKTGFWYADEWPTLVRFSCSQIGLTSGIYQADEPFNDKTNTRHHMLDKHERALRLYNRYIVV
jgi:hypothetical protein